MKPILTALAMLVLVFAAAPKAEARVDVSINFFYDNLGSDGYWLDVDGYGYCWQPNVAVSNRGWRPYADGYWAYTNVGWTWVSYESFGWATYHYGRWARLRNHGWVWVPGYEWGPAWVSWRTGGNYVGWAPLPPRRYSRGGEVVYTGRAINGYVDIEFDIGPSYYNFVDVRYIGAPVLSRHIYAPSQNITYVNQTVNVTNITYNNNTFHNYGPDYDRLSAYSTQPIQRLELERRTDLAEQGSAATSGGFTKVQGDKLVVGAPPVLEKPAEPVAPPTVKTKVEQPNLETGWSDITDEKAKARIQDKMKKEDRNSVPPPEIAPQNPDALKDVATSTPPNPAASPAGGSDAAVAGSSPAGTVDPASAAADKDRGRGRGRDKRPDVAAQPEQPATAPSDASTNAPSTDTTADAATSADNANGRGRGNDKRNPRQRLEQPRPSAAGAQSQETTDTADPVTKPGNEGRGRGKRNQQPPVNAIPAPSDPVSAPPANVPPADVAVPNVQEDRRGKKNRDVRRPDDVRAVEPLREPAAEPRRSRDVPQRVDAPPVEQRNEERGNRGRGRKADRMDDAPAFQPPPQAPREVMQPREQPRMQRMPQPAPQQAAPQEPRGGGRPDKGERKKKQKNGGAPDEAEE